MVPTMRYCSDFRRLENQTKLNFDNYCTSFYVKLAFFTVFVLTLQTVLRLVVVFDFLQMTLSIENVHTPAASAVCKETLLPTKRIFATNAPTSVDSPKILGENLGGVKMFDFRRITLFCLGYCFSRHKMTICSKNWGAWPPSPPGYTYECSL